jgi:type I restriction enzyme S subunit
MENDIKLPNGYKYSKVGVIPEDWDCVKLGTLGTFKKGKGVSTSNTIESGLSAMMYGDIYVKYNTKFYTTDYRISEEDAKGSTPIEKNTLLFTCSGETPEEIGKCVCYLGDDTVYIGGDILSFVQEGNDSLFLAYQQNYYSQIKQKARMGQGNSVVHIYEKQLSSLNVCIPRDINEQRQIAKILSEQDRIIELNEALIERKIQLKKYLLQVLLNYGADYHLRTDEDCDDWKDTQLKKVLKERKEYAEKGTGYEHISLTKEGVVPKSDRYERDFLVKDTEKKYKITRTNDICYNPANLKFGVISRNRYGEGIFSPIYVTYEVSKKYDVDFIGFFVERWDFINRIRKYEQGTVYERMAVSSKDFLRGTFKLPEINEQKSISKILLETANEIDCIKNKVALEKRKKMALMQLLLTGKVRTKIE